jgi:hypothetical protein
VTSVTVEVYTSIFGALAKMLKATVSFVMSVCLSAWNSVAVIGQIFVKFDRGFFENLLRKFVFH